jgi:hypothetical protein
MDDLADTDMTEEAELPDGDAPLEPPPPPSPPILMAITNEPSVDAVATPDMTDPPEPPAPPIDCASMAVDPKPLVTMDFLFST